MPNKGKYEVSGIPPDGHEREIFYYSDIHKAREKEHEMNNSGWRNIRFYIRGSTWL